jgi:hypothetical protein
MDRKLHVGTLILIPTFKIYVFLYSRQMDEQTDGQTEWRRNRPAARGLEELFSTVLEFLQPIHALRV